MISTAHPPIGQNFRDPPKPWINLVVPQRSQPQSLTRSHLILFFHTFSESQEDKEWQMQSAPVNTSAKKHEAWHNFTLRVESNLARPRRPADIIFPPH